MTQPPNSSPEPPRPESDNQGGFDQPYGPYPPQPPYGQYPGAYGQHPYGGFPLGVPPKKHTGLIVGIVVGVLVLLLSVGGIGSWLLLSGGSAKDDVKGDDVKGAVKDYFQASQDKDLAGMKKLLCKSVRSQATTALPPPKGAKLKLDEQKKVSDEEYTVKATVTLDSRSQKLKAVVKKEDGKWLICALGPDFSENFSRGSNADSGSTDTSGASHGSSPSGGSSSDSSF